MARGKHSKKRDRQVGLDAATARLQSRIDKQMLAVTGLNSNHEMKGLRAIVGQLPPSVVDPPPAMQEPPPVFSECVQEPPPVFSECVVGFRVWKIDALGRLRPQSVDQRPWHPGVNVAECDASTYYWPRPFDDLPTTEKKHAAPAKGCACGLYARFNAADLAEREGEIKYTYKLDDATWAVLGSIAAWGDMQIHADGFRAEKACVTALALTDAMPAEIRELVQGIAARYHVPAIPLDTLEAEAMMHGMPLPAEAMPPKPALTAGHASTVLMSELLKRQYRSMMSAHQYYIPLSKRAGP